MEVIIEEMPELETQKALELIGLIVASKAKELVRKDIGMLRDSIQYQVEGNEVSIFSNLPYAAAIEYGRLPGKMPPVEPLGAWAKRHQMEGAGWAIAMKILKKGTLPHPYLRPALFQSRDEILRVLGDKVREIK